MLTSAMKRSVALEQKAQRIYVAYVLQRTLNERAIEKYQRLQASEKGMTVDAGSVVLRINDWHFRIERPYLAVLYRVRYQPCQAGTSGPRWSPQIAVFGPRPAAPGPGLGSRD